MYTEKKPKFSHSNKTTPNAKSHRVEFTNNNLLESTRNYERSIFSRLDGII
jgi:hypothetical protein